MTRVKVCGITNSVDAQNAVFAGADALGFIWVPETPRYLPGFEQGESVPIGVPPFVSRVAVCRNANEAPETLGLLYDTLQYYDYTAEVEQWRGRVRLIQAFRVRNRASVDSLLCSVELKPPDAVLLDAYHEKQLGGAGVTFDWSLALEVKQKMGIPLILAGGLTPENVGTAIRQVRPYAVDISSGVEATPGKKDPSKIVAFFEAIREADASLMEL